MKNILSLQYGGYPSIAANVWWLCVRWGFPALKPIDSTNFNLSTNDYR